MKTIVAEPLTEIWTRRSIARSHIVSAIGLLFDGGPKESINLLAWAACDVLRGVADHTGAQTAQASLLDLIPKEHHKEAIEITKMPYNFSKHAKDDPTEEMIVLSEAAEFVLFAGLHDYKIIYNQWTIEMYIFGSWFAAKHKYLAAFGTTSSRALSNSLFESDCTVEFGRNVLRHYQKNLGIIQSITTDVGVDWVEQ